MTLYRLNIALGILIDAGESVHGTGASNRRSLTPATRALTTLRGKFSANILRQRQFRYLRFRHGMRLVLD